MKKKNRRLFKKKFRKETRKELDSHFKWGVMKILHTIHLTKDDVVSIIAKHFNTTVSYT